MDFKNKAVLIIDNGLFCELAPTLAKSFGKVYYYTPWECAFPRSNTRLVGTGIPGVTRCNDYWEILDDIDLFVFPDIYNGFLENSLIKKAINENLLKISLINMFQFVKSKNRIDF